ncbi:MAG: histidine kinase [Alphaproteobacteria bacterium]|nr:histidine kinase [Alphaproteobacteria bacterium]
MVSETRKSEMREYQKARSSARREIGQVTRTFWIQEEDSDAFLEAVRPFTDRARLLEAVNGTLELSRFEIFGIIQEHRLPYDPEEMVFLSRVGEHLTLHPERAARIVQTAQRIMDRHPDTNLSGVRKRIEGAAPSPDPEAEPRGPETDTLGLEV